MITLIKNGGAKVLDPESTLIPLLKHEGWKEEGETDDLEALKAEAEALGLKVHHKAGADKIREMIEAHKE